MTGGVAETDELAQLLDDVQRTIRENAQFIRKLKDEAVEPENPEDGDLDKSEESFEEL